MSARKSGFKKLFRVVWIDTHFHGGTWHTSAHFKPLQKQAETPCVSVGYFLGKTKKTICMCHTVGGDDFGGIYTIPRGCIIKMRRMK